MREIVYAEARDKYQIFLRFDDGVEGVIALPDIVPFAGVFAPLRDVDVFRRVRVDAELGTICWPNGADLDPLVMYAHVTGLPLPAEPSPTL